MSPDDQLHEPLPVRISLGQLVVSSDDFVHGGDLPPDVGNRGSGTSPHLSWTQVPQGTRSFALISQDQDAQVVGGFWHWTLYGIPGDVRELPRGGGAPYLQGKNGLGTDGWVSAAPTPGHGTHFYHFHIFALSLEPTTLPAGLSAPDLLEAMSEHVLDHGRIVGTYSNG